MPVSECWEAACDKFDCTWKGHWPNKAVAEAVLAGHDHAAHSMTLYGPWPPRCRDDKCFCGPHAHNESDIERKMYRVMELANRKGPDGKLVPATVPNFTQAELDEWRSTHAYLQSNEGKVAMDLNRYWRNTQPGMHERPALAAK